MTPLVDTHAHIYTLDMPVAPTGWHRPRADATAEQYLVALDAAGVHYGVLAAASIYGDYNDYTIAALRHYKRLRATVIVRPDIDPYALQRMKDDGVVGVRFQWFNSNECPDLNSGEYRLLLRRIADLGWHIHLHDKGPRLPDAIATIENAGVRLVIDHFGRPDPKLGVNCPGFQAILKAISRGRTWVKLSAGFRQQPPEAATTYAAELLKHAGPERLMWGSDWPFAAFEDKVRYEQCVRDLETWVPDAKARRVIGADTPLKFYFS